MATTKAEGGVVARAEPRLHQVAGDVTQICAGLAQVSLYSLAAFSAAGTSQAFDANFSESSVATGVTRAELALLIADLSACMCMPACCFV